MNRILTWFLIALIFALSGPLQAASLASARGFEKSLYGRSARQYDKYAYCGGDPINCSDPDGLIPQFPRGAPGSQVSQRLGRPLTEEQYWRHHYDNMANNEFASGHAQSAGPLSPEWAAGNAVGGVIFKGAVGGLRAAGRVAGAGGEIGGDAASGALKRIITNEADEMGYSIIESAKYNGDAHIIGNTLRIGTTSSKAVWLEEFGHLLQPGVRAGTARTGAARLAAETQIKQILINGAEKYGLSPAAVSGLRSSLDGYRRMHQRGQL